MAIVDARTQRTYSIFRMKISDLEKFLKRVKARKKFMDKERKKDSYTKQFKAYKGFYVHFNPELSFFIEG